MVSPIVRRSGTPISTVYSVRPGSEFHPYGRGDLGRTDSFTQTDLFVSHAFSVTDEYSVELSLSVRNLFDEDNVVSVQDVGTSERGLHYIIMQYVDGQSLEEHLQANGARDFK